MGKLQILLETLPAIKGFKLGVKPPFKTCLETITN